MTGVALVRSFPAHPSALFQIRRFVRECADGAGLREDVAHDIVLAVSEASANSVVHTSSPNVKVSWTENEDRVEVVIQDQGVFRRHVPMPEFEGRGHGMPLMMALVDEMTIKEGTPAKPGTLVRLVKLKNHPR